MTYPRLTFLPLLTLLVAATPAAARAQVDHGAHQQAATILSVPRAEIAALAKAEAAIGKIRDSIYKELATPSNKKDETQEHLRETMHQMVDAALKDAGLSREHYAKLLVAIGTDTAAHRVFDSVLVVITGAPLATQVQAVQAEARAGAGAGGAGGSGAVQVPAGAAGVHIGHVVNAFGDTPNGMGLLPTAMAEARTAAQHAMLAARATDDLDGMQLHAGHVLHALDPSQISTGPGLGYGMKKAAMAVANHIELAGAADGASRNIVTHSNHIATAARATAERADEAIAIARKVQTAVNPADAAALIAQLVSLTTQLTIGVDANADGRIDWQHPEGGLQQAQEHVTLMLAAEGGG